MTRAELRQFVRDQAVVESHEISDSLIDTYLNEGYYRVMGRRVWPFAKASEGLTSTAGTSTYNFTGDPRSIISVLDISNDSYLRAIPLERFVVMQNVYENSTTTPEFFYFDDTDLWLFPTPAADGDVYTVWYRTTPAFGTDDTDVPPWYEGYHTMLADWAVQRVWENQEDMDRADTYRSRFESTLMEMDRFYNIRSEDRPMIYGQSKRSFYPTNMPFLNDAANGGAT